MNDKISYQILSRYILEKIKPLAQLILKGFQSSFRPIEYIFNISKNMGIHYRTTLIFFFELKKAYGIINIHTRTGTFITKKY